MNGAQSQGSPSGKSLVADHYLCRPGKNADSPAAERPGVLGRRKGRRLVRPLAIGDRRLGWRMDWTVAGRQTRCARADAGAMD